MTLFDCPIGTPRAALWESSHPRAKHITEQLARMICIDMQPYRIVEDVGFRMYSHALEPKYKLPTRKSLSNDLIPKLYSDCVKTIRHSINGASSLALTTDMWTSVSNEAYMSVTGHYITGEFEMKCKCLDVTYFPDTHTANHLACAVEESVKKWLTPDKKDDTASATTAPTTIPIYVVSDNASNIVAAMRQLPNYSHIACFIHTLQLCILDSIKTCVGLQDVISKGKKIAAFFHRSAKATKRLTDAQASLKLPQHKLIQECPTRWNSAYDMIQRLVEQKAALSLVLVSVTQIDNFTPLEWIKAAQFATTMKPFKEVTVMMSADRYPTISMVIPVLNVLRKMMIQNATGGFVELQDALLQQMERRWPNYERGQIHSICTVLDPRFKTIVFSNLYNARLATNLVVQQMVEVCLQQPIDPSHGSVLSADDVETEVTVVEMEQPVDSEIVNVGEHSYSMSSGITRPERESQQGATTDSTESATFWNTFQVCRRINVAVCQHEIADIRLY